MLKDSTHPNRNQGQGSIPNRRKKHKKHKSQPHARPPRKSKVVDTPSWQSQPLFPGGITTRGQFNESREAAVRQEFAPQEEQIAQAKKEIPAWYGDYLRKLQGLQTQTTQQYEGLEKTAGSLAETAADATPEGQKAAEARNNIVKAIQGALLQQKGAAFTRNQEMAGVAGARQTQRLDEVSTAEKGLAKKKGDFRTTYTTEGRQREFENALAAKQFGLKVQTEANKPKPETTYEKEFSKQASKHGFSPHDWALLGPKGRAKRIQEAQSRSGTKPKSLRRIEREEAIKQAAKHGYSREDWEALPPQKRSAIIRGAKPKKKDTGGEFDWRTPGQRGQGANDAASTLPLIEKLDPNRKNRPKTGKTLLADPEAKEPVLVSAALDAAYDKHLSRETARRLQRAGFKASEIAEALGTKTFTEWRRGASKRRADARSRRRREREVNEGATGGF